MTSREQEANNALQGIAKEIQSLLPPNFGFTLLAYEFGDGDGRTMLYVSNSKREQVCEAMTEFMNKTKEGYGKHVE